jgi:hypothetical protein
MESINFALPTVASSGMTRDDQNVLLVNQATAVIVSSWLSHKNVVLQTGTAMPGHLSAGDVLSAQIVSEGELVSIINAVQGALRTVS